ncbi:MAG: uracil-DNA glycosylase [Lentisphaeria bacterium]|nr:uracil-DNA glycosylase [Lentisphaeria bacterium]
MTGVLPESWERFLRGAGMSPEIWREPLERSALRRREHEVYPPPDAVFAALELTPPDAVRVVLLGQDPYHEPGQAEGLAFSVPEHVPPPPSLRNIFTEYATDLRRPLPTSGSLRPWARGGVLLLNSLLTVDAGAAGSHCKFGWGRFTDGIIAALSARTTGLVFLLWGNFARKKRPLIDPERHTVIAGVHPSPLSAYRGFFGSRPFSATEAARPGWVWPSLH